MQHYQIHCKEKGNEADEDDDGQKNAGRVCLLGFDKAGFLLVGDGPVVCVCNAGWLFLLLAHLGQWKFIAPIGTVPYSIADLKELMSVRVSFNENSPVPEG